MADNDPFAGAFQYGDLDDRVTTLEPMEDRIEKMQDDARSTTSSYETNRAHQAHTTTVSSGQGGKEKIVRIDPHFDETRGKFVVTYMDHYGRLYNDRREDDYFFSAKQFPSFDAIIVDYLKDSKRHGGMYDKQNKHYEAMTPMRDNLAVMRNVIYNMYFPQGSFDSGDKEKQIHLRKMSEKLGHKLKWKARWNRLYNIATLQFFSDKDIANKRFGDYADPHIGAALLYKELYEMQEKPSLNPFNWLKGRASRYDWQLPPPEESPFSEKDINEALFNDQRDKDIGLEDAPTELLSNGRDVQEIAMSIGSSVERLTNDQREESVQHGREILRRLKELAAGRSDRAVEGVGSRREDLDQSVMLRDLAATYAVLYEDMLAQDPSLEYDSTFERARLALGRLGQIAIKDAEKNSDTIEERQQFRDLLANAPEEFQQLRNEPIQELLHDVETAMEELQSRQRLMERGTSPLAQAKDIAGGMSHAMSNPEIGASSSAVSGLAADYNREMADKVEQRKQQRNDRSRQAADQGAPGSSGISFS